MLNNLMTNLTFSQPAGSASAANGMTKEEVVALVQHILLCRSTKNSHPDGVFDLEMTLSPNGTIADTRIVRPKDADFDRVAYNLAMETAADLRTYPCSPLPLPPEKYPAWRQMTLTMDFRPR
jgi:hypothetical protein